MGIGYVQGGTRPVPGHPEAGGTGGMDSGCLWVFRGLQREDERNDHSRVFELPTAGSALDVVKVHQRAALGADHRAGGNMVALEPPLVRL